MCTETESFDSPLLESVANEEVNRGCRSWETTEVKPSCLKKSREFKSRVSDTAICGEKKAECRSIVEETLLSLRELMILERIARGGSNKEIGRDLRISPETVKTHIKSIFIKLNVNRRILAVARAQALGWGSGGSPKTMRSDMWN